MKNRHIAALFLCGAMSLSLLSGCGSIVQNSGAAVGIGGTAVQIGRAHV